MKLFRDETHSCGMALCSHDRKFSYCRKLFVILSLKCMKDKVSLRNSHSESKIKLQEHTDIKIFIYITITMSNKKKLENIHLPANLEC